MNNALTYISTNDSKSSEFFKKFEIDLSEFSYSGDFSTEKSYLYPSENYLLNKKRKNNYLKVKSDDLFLAEKLNKTKQQSFEKESVRFNKKENELDSEKQNLAKIEQAIKIKNEIEFFKVRDKKNSEQQQQLRKFQKFKDVFASKSQKINNNIDDICLHESDDNINKVTYKKGNEAFEDDLPIKKLNIFNSSNIPQIDLTMTTKDKDEEEIERSIFNTFYHNSDSNFICKNNINSFNNDKNNNNNNLSSFSSFSNIINNSDNLNLHLSEQSNSFFNNFNGITDYNALGKSEQEKLSAAAIAVQQLAMLLNIYPNNTDSYLNNINKNKGSNSLNDNNSYNNSFNYYIDSSNNTNNLNVAKPQDFQGLLEHFYSNRNGNNNNFILNPNFFNNLNNLNNNERENINLTNLLKFYYQNNSGGCYNPYPNANNNKNANLDADSLFNPYPPNQIISNLLNGNKSTINNTLNLCSDNNNNINGNSNIDNNNNNNSKKDNSQNSCFGGLKATESFTTDKTLNILPASDTNPPASSLIPEKTAPSKSNKRLSDEDLIRDLCLFKKPKAANMDSSAESKKKANNRSSKEKSKEKKNNKAEHTSNNIFSSNRDPIIFNCINNAESLVAANQETSTFDAFALMNNILRQEFDNKLRNAANNTAKAASEIKSTILESNENKQAESSTEHSSPLKNQSFIIQTKEEDKEIQDQKSAVAEAAEEPVLSEKNKIIAEDENFTNKKVKIEIISADLNQTLPNSQQQNNYQSSSTESGSFIMQNSNEKRDFIASAGSNSNSIQYKKPSTIPINKSQHNLDSDLNFDLYSSSLLSSIISSFSKTIENNTKQDSLSPIILKEDLITNKKEKSKSSYNNGNNIVNATISDNSIKISAIKDLIPKEPMQTDFTTNILMNMKIPNTNSICLGKDNFTSFLPRLISKNTEAAKKNETQNSHSKDATKIKDNNCNIKKSNYINSNNDKNNNSSINNNFKKKKIPESSKNSILEFLSQEEDKSLVSNRSNSNPAAFNKSSNPNKNAIDYSINTKSVYNNYLQGKKPESIKLRLEKSINIINNSNNNGNPDNSDKNKTTKDRNVTNFLTNGFPTKPHPYTNAETEKFNNSNREFSYLNKLSSNGNSNNNINSNGNSKSNSKSIGCPVINSKIKEGEDYFDNYNFFEGQSQAKSQSNHLNTNSIIGSNSINNNYNKGTQNKSNNSNNSSNLTIKNARNDSYSDGNSIPFSFITPLNVNPNIKLNNCENKYSNNTNINNNNNSSSNKYFENKNILNQIKLTYENIFNQKPEPVQKKSEIKESTQENKVLNNNNNNNENNYTKNNYNNYNNNNNNKSENTQGVQVFGNENNSNNSKNPIDYLDNLNFNSKENSLFNDLNFNLLFEFNNDNTDKNKNTEDRFNSTKNPNKTSDELEKNKLVKKTEFKEKLNLLSENSLKNSFIKFYKETLTDNKLNKDLFWDFKLRLIFLEKSPNFFKLKNSTYLFSVINNEVTNIYKRIPLVVNENVKINLYCVRLIIDKERDYLHRDIFVPEKILRKKVNKSKIELEHKKEIKVNNNNNL